MTGQVSDLFLYNDEEYQIVGIDGSDLFVPQEHGFFPKMATTACWRGFQLFYKIIDDFLVLDAMSINVDQNIKFKGIEPKKTQSPLKYLYENLQFRLDFTGRILLGSDFIDELYVHMGFQSPQSYRKVIELDFKKGKLLTVNNLSERMENRRKQKNIDDYQPKSSDEEDIKEWIQERFSLSYDSKLKESK